MLSSFRSVLAVMVLLVAAASAPSPAQQQMNMPAAGSTAPYHPGLGELMTAFVQPRHIKLGLAGRTRNWPYAAYALQELAETFDDVAKLVPKHDDLAIPEMLKSTVVQPMKALDAAIKANDADAFNKAYADLTTACNACHNATNHPMIVIQVPTFSSFPDQDFRRLHK
jgi:hypothetical protein